jgi:hypothetical protein
MNLSEKTIGTDVADIESRYLHHNNRDFIRRVGIDFNGVKPDVTGILPDPRKLLGREPK